MASKGEKRVNKSQLIRETKTEHPEAGPTEISAMLKEKHGIDVSPPMISTVLSQDRIRGGQPRKRGRPPKGTKKLGPARPAKASKASEVTLDNLVHAKVLVDKMGGIQEAKTALDALSRLFQ